MRRNWDLTKQKENVAQLQGFLLRQSLKGMNVKQADSFGRFQQKIYSNYNSKTTLTDLAPFFSLCVGNNGVHTFLLYL